MPAEVLILDSTSVYFFILVLGVCIYCYFGDLTLKKKQNKTQIHPHSHNLQTNKFKEENRHHPRCVFKASVCKSSINLSSKFWQQVISHQRCYEGRSIASKNKSLMTWGVLLCNSRARGVPGIQWHLRKRWQRCLLLHQTATTHSTEPPSAIFSHLWPLFFLICFEWGISMYLLSRCHPCKLPGSCSTDQHLSSAFPGGGVKLHCCFPAAPASSPSLSCSLDFCWAIKKKSHLHG